MGIQIDKRIQKYVEGFLHGENDKVISIYLKDIDETFWFTQIFNYSKQERYDYFLYRRGNRWRREKELVFGRYI